MKETEQLTLHRIQEVLLRRDLPPRPNREHPGLCTDTPQLGSGRVGTKTGDEVVADGAFDGHAARAKGQEVSGR
jgi:hypothetical protein